MNTATTTEAPPCTCTTSPRCDAAYTLWEAANAVYRADGHAAWDAALTPYREHFRSA